MKKMVLKKINKNSEAILSCWMGSIWYMKKMNGKINIQRFLFLKLIIFIYWNCAAKIFTIRRRFDMAEKLEAVILDWAGTTMDYGCYAPAVAFRQVFAEMGVPISMLEARRPMGKHKKVHIGEIANDPEVAKRWFAVHKRMPTEEDVDKMFEAFQPAQLPYLTKYAGLIPGTLEAVEECRLMGLKIGSTTGYTGEMMDLLLNEAAEKGYFPDVSVCATGHYVLLGGELQGPLLGYGKDISRPNPAMCNLNAYLLNVSDNAAVVKVGDTLDDIREGKRAGMWTIGLAGTGNELYFGEEHEGLTEEQIRNRNPEGFRTKLKAAYSSMQMKSPDYIADSIRDVHAIIYGINKRLENGLKPGQLVTRWWTDRKQSEC